MASVVSNVRIEPEAFEKTLVAYLGQYGDAVAAEAKKVVDLTTEEFVKDTKATAPKRKVAGRPPGTYARHISSKVGANSLRAYSKVWYVRSPEHTLTHLLNFGHGLRQGGRWEGDPFLSKSWAVHSAKLMARMEEVGANAAKRRS